MGKTGTSGERRRCQHIAAQPDLRRLSAITVGGGPHMHGTVRVGIISRLFLRAHGSPTRHNSSAPPWTRPPSPSTCQRPVAFHCRRLFGFERGGMPTVPNPTVLFVFLYQESSSNKFTSLRQARSGNLESVDLPNVRRPMAGIDPNAGPALLALRGRCFAGAACAAPGRGFVAGPGMHVRPCADWLQTQFFVL